MAHALGLTPRHIMVNYHDRSDIELRAMVTVLGITPSASGSFVTGALLMSYAVIA